MLTNTLKEFLEARGIAPGPASGLLGFSYNTFYHYTNDPSKLPSMKIITKVCSYWNVPPSEFLHFEPLEQ